jgi:serine/threonine-protein kinase
MPTTLGRYDVYEKIASGGMGEVYLARLPIGSNAFCALKVLRDDLSQDPVQVEMFHAESKLLHALSHPATVQVYEDGFEGGRHFIAMELLVGQSLLALWDVFRRRKAKIPYDLLAWIGARVAEALHHAHGIRDPATGTPENVVHRDVSPSNVLVTFDGRVKIIDFGLAKAASQQIKTATGVLKGKVGYLSPEQLDGFPADRRADVFAVATTLWELSCDRRLFKAESDVDTVVRVSKCEIPDPRTIASDYPDILWTVLKRGLVRDRDARYQTAGELSRDLYNVAASMGRNIGPMMLGDLMRDVCART